MIKWEIVYNNKKMEYNIAGITTDYYGRRFISAIKLGRGEFDKLETGLNKITQSLFTALAKSLSGDYPLNSTIYCELED